jgi:hypothetical protein
MYRELAQIAIAIQLSGPHLSMHSVNRFAPVIQHEAEVHNIDPFVFIAYIDRESQWSERVISKDGFDYGLCQVRAMFHAGDHPNSLLIGENNIRACTSVILASQKLCRDYLGREPEFQEYSKCFIGACKGDRTCRPNRATYAEEQYLGCIAEQVIQGVCREDCHQIFMHQEPRNHR